MRLWLAVIAALAVAGPCAAEAPEEQQPMVPTVVVISEPPPAPQQIVFVSAEEKKSVDWWARGLGFFGALLGACSFLFTYRKAKRDRRLSIDDDFWLRKVLAPAVIEPIIEEIGRLVHNCPDSNAPSRKIRTFTQDVSKSLQKLKGNLGALSMINEGLPDSFQDALDACEDSLTLATQSSTGKADLQREIWAQLTKALQEVRSYQMSR